MKESEGESRSVVSNSLCPHGLYSPWNSPGQNTGVGSLSLLQGIFPTQGLNPGLPHCKRILYQLSYPYSITLYNISTVCCGIFWFVPSHISSKLWALALTCWYLPSFWASLVAQTVKNLLAMWETWVQSLGWEDPLEKFIATHSSILGLPSWLNW